MRGAGELIKFNEITTSLHQICGLDTKYPECMHLLTTAHLDTIADNYLAYLNSIDNKLERVTDKMPQNFFHLGLIVRVFPQAAIIHCIRNKMDTCLSIFFQSFNASHSYSTDSGNIAFFYNSYLRLMKHWKTILDRPVLNIKYEDMVTDQERISRDIISFCGLEWDDACLTFYKSNRHVATASFNQVKEPVYTRSVNRWQHYNPFIKKLIDELSL